MWLERELRELKAARGVAMGQSPGGGSPAGTAVGTPKRAKHRFAKFSPFWGCRCGFGDTFSGRAACLKCRPRPGRIAAVATVRSRRHTVRNGGAVWAAAKTGAKAGAQQQAPVAGSQPEVSDSDTELAEAKTELASAQKWPWRQCDSIPRPLPVWRRPNRAPKPTGRWARASSRPKVASTRPARARPAWLPKGVGQGGRRTSGCLLCQAELEHLHREAPAMGPPSLDDVVRVLLASGQATAAMATINVALRTNVPPGPAAAREPGGAAAPAARTAAAPWPPAGGGDMEFEALFDDLGRPDPGARRSAEAADGEAPDAIRRRVLRAPADVGDKAVGRLAAA